MGFIHSPGMNEIKEHIKADESTEDKCPDSKKLQEIRKLLLLYKNSYASSVG